MIPVTNYGRFAIVGSGNSVTLFESKTPGKHDSMWLKSLNSGKTVELGKSLADQITVGTADRGGGGKKARVGKEGRELQGFLERIDREARPMQLGIFRRAKLASTFKWRLLDNGMEPEVVDELTQMLLVRLASNSTGSAADETRFAITARQPEVTRTQPEPQSKPGAGEIDSLLAQGDQLLRKAEYAAAADCYSGVLETHSSHVVARNNLGIALWKLGRCAEAEDQFRHAINIRANYVEAQLNLGCMLREAGRFEESQLPLRRALKLDPRRVEAHVNLGLALIQVQHLPEAGECFDKALKIAPQHALATYGRAQLAGLEGRFEEAEALYKRAFELDPTLSSAWPALAGLRKMTPADGPWLKQAEKIASSGLAPLHEADVRFAIGKYYDDTGDFARAFRNYSQGNELRRPFAESYVPQSRERFVDDLIRVYSRESFGLAQASGSDSAKPVFVVGMMRSGTSLVEQIIASHPNARGAGELSFWNNTVRKHFDVVRTQWIDEALRKKLAKAYLQQLSNCSAEALRVVDKTPVNSDYLGLIYSVFPNARVIYVQRDPIDTCLSCHFSQLPTMYGFTTNLSDLAHYYRQHRRLADHWRSVLPKDMLLHVPYSELVDDQEKWTRRILDFLGLEWDERCLEFHKTQRPVLTASYWQVRQKLYRTSVGRWQNYKKFIEPLLELHDLEP